MIVVGGGVNFLSSLLMRYEKLCQWWYQFIAGFWNEMKCNVLVWMDGYISHTVLISFCYFLSFLFYFIFILPFSFAFISFWPLLLAPSIWTQCAPFMDFSCQFIFIVLLLFIDHSFDFVHDFFFSVFLFCFRRKSVTPVLEFAKEEICTIWHINCTYGKRYWHDRLLT